MKRKRDKRKGIFLLFASCALGCSGVDPTADDARQGASGTGSRGVAAPGDRLSLPVYRVVGRAADPERAADLAAALGLERGSFLRGALVQPDGAIRYLDSKRFQRLPTKKADPPVPGFRDESGRATSEGGDAMDFEALKALQVLPGEEAIARAKGALDLSGLAVNASGASGALASASHAELTAVDAGGAPVARADLDTQVSFAEELSGLRLIGPGAKVRVTFDGDGVVTHVVYARRELERGEEVEVVGPSEAKALCAAALGGEVQESAPELVYYAPPLSVDAARIVPHYVCGGTLARGDQAFDVRRAIVPALASAGAPEVSLDVRAAGAEVAAQASVRGGTPPYRFAWASSTRSLDRTLSDASTIAYTLHGANERPAPETLSVVVTDADGLAATASRAVDATPSPTPQPTALRPSSMRVRESSQGTVGTEWVGSCAGLESAAANVDGLVGAFHAAGVDATFNWGDGRAWEIDFKDAAFGGQDASFADSVDLTFYTGHANGSGFMFCSNVSDGFLGYGDAHWGNSNLEWLVIAACGPLQDDQGAWRSRWAGAFDGLHLLLGYASESFDDTTEGSTFADYLLDRASPLPVRQAWVTTTIDIQPDDEVTYAVMGVYGAGWTIPNYDDHFWGKGSVGPDLRGTAKIGYWRISGKT